MLYFYNVSPAFGPLICVSPLSPTLPSLYTIFSSARHLCNLSSQRRYDTPAGSILRYTASSPFFYESRKALLLFAKVIHTRHRSASTCLTRRGGSFYCAKPPSEPIRCNGLPAAGDFFTPECVFALEILFFF